MRGDDEGNERYEDDANDGAHKSSPFFCSQCGRAEIALILAEQTSNRGNGGSWSEEGAIRPECLQGVRPMKEAAT